MATTSESTDGSGTSRMHVRRSKGVLSGILLVLLGLWGGLIPFIGPGFDYAYTPDLSWHFTWGRFWLEVLPGVATILGGLMLIGSANRAVTVFGGWLAALAGAWFVVGPILSGLWNSGASIAGVPASPGVVRSAMEQIGFFFGLGVAIVFLAALALGRMTVVGVRDVAAAAGTSRDTTRDPEYNTSRSGPTRDTSASYRSTTGEPDTTDDTSEDERLRRTT
jgi:hypothetical protein